MHWKRLLTVLVLVPIVILIIFKGGPFAFLILTVVVGWISLWEFFTIAFTAHAPPVPRFYPVWAYVNATLLLVAASQASWPGMLFALFANLAGAATFSVFHFSQSHQAPGIVIKQTFGVLYISLALACAVLIHAGTHGPEWVFFVIWVIAWGDSGAFYAGSYLGRHKLCPAVSPGKTIEGALGGLAANLVSALIYKLLIFEALPLAAALVFAVAGGAVGQIGDLFESEFKRAAGVKDSGKLLPGHGGFLDRIDALLLATPLAYFLKALTMP